MRNKGFIIFLTVVVMLLCLYYLSFTFVSRGIQQDATAYATEANGTVDFAKKQAYLDSVYREPVYNLLGMKFTYEEVQENELSLGLDLKGGMHVTLEVSPVEIVKGLAGGNDDPAFLAAIQDAVKAKKTSNENFTTLFYQAFQERKPDTKLSTIFANAANRERINFETTDQEILNILREEINGAVDRSFEILRTRIDRFGTSQPNIQRLQGTGRIQIELPGVDNPERVRNLLQGVAKLEFYEVYQLDEYGSSLEAINQKLLEEEKSKSGKPELETTETEPQASEDDLAAILQEDEATVGTPADSATADSATAEDDLAAQLESSDTSSLDSLANSQVSSLFRILNVSQFGLTADVRDTAKINDIFSRDDIQNLLPPSLEFHWAVKPRKMEGSQGTELLTLYPIKTGRGGKAPLTGEVITDARQDYDQRSTPAVFMTMDATGAKKWQRLTGDNINRQIAIVLDGYVLSAPNVESEIPGGSSVISGNFEVEEAKDLANLLKAGALPAPTDIVEEAIIGPSLGQEAQAQGIISILAGLGMVVILMVAYYAKGGFTANLALLFNIFFILGILAQLNASLTLPGIAGIVLTMGMAVDANVLIFERIKEELRSGAGLKSAISLGYDKAYSSIIDGNATTFLTALILYVVGQGPVKGFAITLMIGIVTSFFTAVFINRVVVEWMARKGDESKMSFSFAATRNFLANIHVDFLGRRKMAYILSGIFIGAGLIAMVIKPLNMGVDFTGGRSYVVTFNDPVVPSDLSVSLADDFVDAGTQVKTYGANNVLQITTSYMIDNETSAADAKVREVLVNGISEFTGQEYVSAMSQVDAGHFTISSSTKVGATIASDIKRSSMQSVIFSLIVVFLYLLIRFRRWQFGMGAVLALLHDSLCVFSAFAIAGLLGFRLEIDQVFIAAILTVIGYSINDTVIIFDRVREELGLRPRSELQGTINSAINNTLSRTMVTSGSTLLVVLILFLFGGAVLKGFSFALLVGIITGTYSSIFIATPVVIDLTKRKQTKAPATKVAGQTAKA